MGQFSLIHILILLVIVLIFFGPSRLPGLGSSLGKAIKGFKDGIDGKDDDEKQKELLTHKEQKSDQKSKAESAERESKKENS